MGGGDSGSGDEEAPARHEHDSQMSIGGEDETSRISRRELMHRLARGTDDDANGSPSSLEQKGISIFLRLSNCFDPQEYVFIQFRDDEYS